MANKQVVVIHRCAQGSKSGRASAALFGGAEGQEVLGAFAFDRILGAAKELLEIVATRRD